MRNAETLPDARWAWRYKSYEVTKPYDSGQDTRPVPRD